MSSTPTLPPDKILGEAVKTLQQRGTDYDGKGYQGGERSMAQTVAIFKEFTGIQLSELDGWRFLMCLKMARSTTGKPKVDTYVDLAAYAGLAGECHLGSRLEVGPERYGPVVEICGVCGKKPHLGVCQQQPVHRPGADCHCALCLGGST